MATLALPEDDDDKASESSSSKSIDTTNLGMFVPFEISDEEMYGPDHLSEEMLTAIKGLPEACGKYEDAARIWEVVQAAEARLWDRGYQWLTNAESGGGWVVAGTSGNSGMGAGAIVRQDKGRMWACNIYGARKDKIVAALTVKDPVPEFFPTTPGNALDEKAAEESGKYKHLWKQINNVRNMCVKVGGLFYTDDRTALITESVKFGDKVEEKTRAYGKLEFRVPMSIDEDDPLPWCCRMREMDIASAKEKYEWIDTKITAGAGGRGQIDRTCRLTVRNAVQNQTQWTSNASDRAVTEETWWIRPSQFRDVGDKELRKQLREMCPDGARIVFAGGEFAYIRNEKMDDCVIILYSREGTGQNRRAIGSNNLVTNKILNYDISLFNRYMTACVPRKLHIADAINSEAINQQRSDPAFSMPVDGAKAQEAGGLQNVTGIENVPSPPAELMEFISSLTEGLPDVLDGASPSMFGGTDGTDTATGITIQRDQALQVFGTPYNAMTWGIAISCGNAARWAGRTRQGTASGMVPGVGRISVDFEALKGETYCFPEADSGFPESEAEKEARLEKFIDAGGMPTLIAAAGGPQNFEAINRVTKRFGVRVAGTNSVQKQQGEFEKLLKTIPMPNPAYLQAAMQVQQIVEQSQGEPDAQTPQGQQGMQQLQQQLQSIPQLLPSVPVEQDASVDHGIEAAICFDKMNSEDGQKLKREKPQIFENLQLHWQGHTDMTAKLSPPPAMPEVRPGISLAVDKLSGEVQAAVLQKEYGIQVTPEQTQPSTDVHEVEQTKEGVDAQGIPVTQRIAYSGKPLQ